MRNEIAGAETKLAEALPTDLIEIADAAELAHRPADTVRMWCRANPIDQPGGFALKLQGRWLISRPRFLEFLTPLTISRSSRRSR